MKKITDAGNLKGKRVLVRMSLNVPIKDGKVLNNYRIRQGLPTLRYLHESGAKTIILSHLGREKTDTLKPVLSELETYIPVQWGGTIGGEECTTRAGLMGDGDFLLVENLRQDDREEANDEGYAKEIAALGDIYVNDDFAASHREHASLSALAKLLPAYAGLNLLDEVTHLARVMQPEHPSLFMIGGAKFETKMPLVEKYLDEYDHVFISGALMNDVFKAKGWEVGTSLVSNVSLEGAPFLRSEKLVLPVDVVVKGPSGTRTISPMEVQEDEAMLDVGPSTVLMLESYIEKAKTILWNGPFGNYEAGFKTGTEETAKLLATANAFTVVGGGDSVAAIEKLGLNEKLGFVSTAGGAMLEYLEKGTLPTLELLNG